MSARCSAPNALPSTPGILRVCSRCCTRITLQGWELHVPWYVLHGYVVYDMYVIYMSYASLNCMSCYSFSANSYTYTSPAINIKLIYSVSMGSAVTSGAQLLFTGTQLRCCVVDCRELYYRRRHSATRGRCGLWWSLSDDLC